MHYTLKPALSRLTLAAAALALASAALAPTPAFAKTKHSHKMHTMKHTMKHTKMHRTLHSRRSAAHPMAPAPTPGHVLPGVRNSVGDVGGTANPPSGAALPDRTH